MNEKLKSILEARKKSKAAKSGFKQTSATDLKSKGLVAPKKGLSGAGPEAAKVPVKPKKMNESNIPAFGARFNKLVESTLAAHNQMLSEDDASDLYYEFNDDLSVGDAEAIINDEQGEDTVTLTLDKETAKKLHDILMAAMGEEGEDEEAGEGMEEEGFALEKKDEEDEDEDKEVVEEEGSYQISQANLGAGEKLANPGSKVVKSKLGARPGKAGTVKSHDSSGSLASAPGYKQQDMAVKSNMSGVGKDLF
jgi:hypothetical protein